MLAPGPVLSSSIRQETITRIIHNIENVNTGSSTSTSFKKFQLSSTSGGVVTDLAKLYDQYRVTELQFKWIPTEVVNTSANKLGYILIAPDYDDGAALTYYDEVLAYNQASVHSSGKEFVLKIRPQTTESATHTVKSPNQWYNLSDDTIPFCGFQIWYTTNCSGVALMSAVVNFKAGR